MTINLNSTLRDLMKNPDAVALLEKYAPDLSKSPMFKLGMGMKLEKCIKIAKARLTEEQIKAVEKDLKALGIDLAMA